MVPKGTCDRAAVKAAHIEAVRADYIQDLGKGAGFVADGENQDEVLAAAAWQGGLVQDA